ncbi:MAG TPA: pyrroloquinoline quinone-dependent dehydrogenase [Steroidobacteraceae bacterium]|nr:pyrroloquinoline quinone-dependent dehydrogenase [Steroidobacteraceae bacterium]
MRIWKTCLLMVSALCLCGAHAADGDWLNYGRDAGGTRYAPLTQITPANVGQLKLAWSYRLDPPVETVAHPYVAFEGTPLEVADTVYFCTPASSVVALDAETGKPRWKFAPRLRKWGGFRACRGIAYYEASPQSTSCRERIIAATVDARMYAVDARTGELCEGFGDHGWIDLLTGMGKMTPGVFTPTSAPTIVRGRVVIGGMVIDNGQTNNPSGVVRAYDATNGSLAWAWDLDRPHQHGAPAPGEIYSRNTPNAWGPFSADETLGLLFVPTGNSNPDYYGAHRTAQAEKYSSSIVALDAGSGEVRWSFQTTHHDLWDYDVGSQPVLTTLGGVPALIQPTKRGEIFVLDRRDGHPLMPVVERPVPQGGGAGDWTAKTQPFSTGLPELTGPDLTEKDMWGITPIDQLWCRIQFRRARYDGAFTPPTPDRPWIYSPGWMGGSDWGGVSVDESRNVLVAVSMRMANYEYFLSAQQLAALSDKSIVTPQVGSPYAGIVSDYFHSPIGVPCQRPPYGVISAIDLKTGAMLWSHPLGTARSSGPLKTSLRVPFSIPMGAVTLGGNLVTGSGLIFVGAALDRYLRAFDERTGQELWRADLSAPAFATPMSYLSPQSGRQFVVAAVGGNNKFGPNHGLYIQAYALPAEASR